ncbi:MAG: glycosyltransferase family 4 protein [Chloroflexi bacterium]|nr:glycosyltransferase family 4 protein [Chloroflexota bacterium]MCY3583507.1 glycosyltransferase family 4 protein [Chloroflexota bacterium]MCY3716180.1 glycosyltransferase family 4 protein [Chloroflexota bacterium]MDE2650865.1 glycosyltransferase family 4 protein [Chloroflexota bacterium]MXV94215.1 glycosyltransferase family 4 protein [Chloroflexota bacterium]
MPKLLVASGIFYPEPGGPATYLRALLPALQKRGWQVRVLTYGASQADGDCPYPVKRIERKSYPLRLATYALAAHRGLAWADVVYSHTIDLPLWTRRRAPRIMKVVGDQAWERCLRKGWIPPELGIDDFQQLAGDWRIDWQKRSRSRQVAAQDAVIAPSMYLRDMALGWGVGPANIHVIYNALPAMELPSEPRHSLRARLGWGDAPTLLTVARLQRWKGIDHLLEALAGLPDVRLVVAGDGPDRARLEGLALPLGERVQFTGRLPAADVLRRMKAADGVALYSAYEGLSHTLLESLRVGTPVLASAVGGNVEVVKAGINGLLVPHVDIAALRAGIVELLARRAELAANTPLGLEKFAFDRMVAATDATLRSLLA